MKFAKQTTPILAVPNLRKMNKPDFLEVAATALGATPVGDEVYTHEFALATVLTDVELDAIDHHAQAAFMDERIERPYVLVALCGSILSNIVRQSDGELTAEELMKWVEIATTSQLQCNDDTPGHTHER